MVRVLMRQECLLRGPVTRRGRVYARGELLAAEQSNSEPSVRRCSGDL